jgi:acyl-homoserine lactone acylase PvdQ
VNFLGEKLMAKKCWSYPRSTVRWLPLAMLLALCANAQARAAGGTSDIIRWQREALAVTITRDDWGIAHVHGKTDADAVFGMAYAQAEDDFNRVETNYLNAMGQLAQADGESAIWQDLRMKLFIDPVQLKALYAKSPAYLQALMNSWADGLNDYLATHPDVHPRVITHFEPWMALSFSRAASAAISNGYRSISSKRSTLTTPTRSRGSIRRRAGPNRPARMASPLHRSSPSMATRCC